MFKLASKIQHYIPSLVVAFILLLSLGWNGCLGGANLCKYEEHYQDVKLDAKRILLKIEEQP